MPTPKPRPSLTYDFFSSSLRKQLRIVLNQFFGIFLQPDDHFLLHLDVQIDLDGLVRGLHLYADRKPHYCSQHHAPIGNYRSKFICLHSLSPDGTLSRSAGGTASLFLITGSYPKDRKSVVSGKRWYVRVDLGVRGTV